MSVKVLMIDDDPAMTELIALLLRSHGMSVVACNDSTQSVEMVKGENPDVILLDLMMPGQDGWEVCKAIRAFSRVPIAILSAIDDPAVIASALDSGADDYLVKPTPGGVLVAHINNLARRHLAEQKNALIRQTGSLVTPSVR
ncbi:MAG: response regulator [Anaerolineales bacterium]|nr:response regulator [Anaerolineales bacterium]MCX7756478.1 response regulator [Anaerolineales bacterium]MDW8278351.1 response regulator [Anaerolineales bacterium]